MTLSYKIDPFRETSTRRKIKVHITTKHSASRYGQPVMVLPDGDALDLMSWALCDYRVETATAKERAILAGILSITVLAVS